MATYRYNTYFLERNPRIDWMEKPAVLKMDGGQAAILLGLVTTEWSEVRIDANRQPYAKTLEDLRSKLIEAQPQ